jgi:plasmid stability protein
MIAADEKGAMILSGTRALTVRGLDQYVYDALQETARSHGRSMEAEARKILADAVAPEPRTLADLARLLPPVDIPWTRLSGELRPVDLE